MKVPRAKRRDAQQRLRQDIKRMHVEQQVHPGGGELGGKPRLAHARRRKRPVTEPLGQRHCRAEGKYCNHFMT